MMKFLLLFLLLPLLLPAVTIKIINDSNYELKAVIYDPQKQVVGSSVIAPDGNYYTWIDSYQGASDWTDGPFTVRFFCSSGAEYGWIYRVADGVTVRAKGAIGPRRCSAPS